MKEELEKKIEGLKKKSEVMDMLLDMLAETGEPRAVCMKKMKELQNSVGKFYEDMDISDDKINKLASLLDQFAKMVKDLKEEL